MTLRELYVADLGHLRDMAQRLLLEWPLLAARADTPGLRAALDARYRETQAHLLQLESLFADLDERARPAPPAGLCCLLDAWHARHGQLTAADLRDLCVVTTVVGIDALGIAAYTEAAAAASAIGHSEGARVLHAELQRRRDEMQLMAGLADSLATRLGRSKQPAGTLPPLDAVAPAVWAPDSEPPNIPAAFEGPPPDLLSSPS